MTCLRILLPYSVAELFRHRIYDYHCPYGEPWLQGRVLYVPCIPEILKATGLLLPPKYRQRLRQEGYEVTTQPRRLP